MNIKKVFFYSVAFFTGLSISTTSLHAETKTLNLASLIDEAIKNHPQLRKINGDAKAAADVPSRIGSLPDPMLQFTAQNFRTDDFKYDSSPMSALGIGLIQKIPFPGKLSRKSRVATSHASTLLEKERLAKALVIHQLTQAYWNLHFSERALSITQENIKVIDVLADVAINRVKVAKVAQQDAFQAQVAHSKLRAKLTKRNALLRNAKRNLNRTIGRDPELALEQTSSPPLKDIILINSNLIEDLKTNSPYLKVSKLRVDKNLNAVAEAKYDRFPDFKIGLNYKVRDIVPGDKTNGADMVSVTLGVTIPLWMGSKQNARVSENINKLMAARAQDRDVNLGVSTRLSILNEKISQLNNEIRLYQKEVLPRADKALNASINDYKSAKVGFVSVVRNWNTELELQINYEKLLKNRAITLSEIELVTGVSLRRLNL